MQRGFVRKRGTTWSAYYHRGVGPFRRQHAKGGFRTKIAAQAYLNTTVAALQRGDFVEHSRLTVATYLRGRWLPLARHSIRPSTLDGYERLIDTQIVPALGRVPLQRLTTEHLDDFYAQLLTNGRRLSPGGLAPKTVRNVHVILHKALGDAVRKQLVTRNVAATADAPTLRRSQSPEMKTWTAGQLRAFLEGSRGHWLRAGFLLAATTGMRRGEVLGLRWADVDLDARRAAIRQTVLSINWKVTLGTPKTNRGRRSIALDATTVRELRLHRERQQRERNLVDGYEDNDLVIADIDGRPWHPRRFTDGFQAELARLKLPRIRLHDLRHTHATLGLAAGIQPKVMADRLGHATSAFTQDVYMHAIPQLEASAAEQVADLIFGTGATDS